MKDEIIYSRTFPHENPDALIAAAAEQDADAEYPGFAELMRDAETKYEYRPRQHAQQQTARFIELAKAVSTEYEVDLTITRSDFAVTADLYLPFGPYAAYLKRALDRVVQMVDEVSLFAQKARPYGVTVSLCLYTHDRFRGGEKVEWL